MSTPYVGEIRMFAGNFAPVGWAFCQGQPLSISENPTLFALIGTTYGGDGRSTFALPDLQGRFPLHTGSGPGLSDYFIGQMGGTESVTLSTAQMPAHNHNANCSGGTGNAGTPAGNYWSTDPAGATAAYNENGGAAMAAGAIGTTGGSLPHDNMSPFVAVNFIISLFGVFPSQS